MNYKILLDSMPHVTDQNKLHQIIIMHSMLHLEDLAVYHIISVTLKKSDYALQMIINSMLYLTN